jgi:predicted tellurium resistance membrane protein TerC
MSELLAQLIEPFMVFTWTALVTTLSNPANYAIIFGLVISEGLLSADNAIVLAVLVRHLPDSPEKSWFNPRKTNIGVIDRIQWAIHGHLELSQRQKALFYGIVGAWGFRILAIAISVYLMQTEWIQIVGGLYLLHLAVKHFKETWSDESNIAMAAISLLVVPNLYVQYVIGAYLGWSLYKYFQHIRHHDESGDDEEVDEAKVSNYGFWRTVFAVECMDVAFSSDSILAAIGMSNNVWIRLIGELAGIAMMRVAASFFIKLIDWCPNLEHTAYALITLVGVKMISSGSGIYELNNMVFIGLMVAMFAGTIIYSKPRDCMWKEYLSVTAIFNKKE